MPMKTMVRNICDSKRAYAIVLNSHCKNSQTTRYAVYVETENGLVPLWPKDEEKLLPNQVKTDLKNYPCYHFAVSGYQFNHFHDIRRTLQRINPEIECFVLRGWFPSENG